MGEAVPLSVHPRTVEIADRGARRRQVETVNSRPTPDIINEGVPNCAITTLGFAKTGIPGR